jgi:hypothetical protein
VIVNYIHRSFAKDRFFFRKKWFLILWSLNLKLLINKKLHHIFPLEFNRCRQKMLVFFLSYSFVLRKFLIFHRDYCFCFKSIDIINRRKHNDFPSSHQKFYFIELICATLVLVSVIFSIVSAALIPKSFSFQIIDFI